MPRSKLKGTVVSLIPMPYVALAPLRRWVSHAVAGKSMARMNKYKTASTMQMRPTRLSLFKSHMPRTRHARQQQIQSTAKIRKPNCESNRIENGDAILAIPNNKMSSAGGESIKRLVCVSTFMMRRPPDFKPQNCDLISLPSLWSREHCGDGSRHGSGRWRGQPLFPACIRPSGRPESSFSGRDIHCCN
jgi:hypothetical protein